MKISIVLLFSCLLSSVAAYGPKAGWEKILYYTTYLLEEQAFGDDHSRYTVGTGCAGSRPGGRCTFVEFTEYIWKPHDIRLSDDETVKSERPRPLPRNFPGSGNLDTWLRANEVTIVARFARTGYLFNVDGMKINGVEDYYESLAKIGRDFHRALDAAPKVEVATQKLALRGALAVRSVENLRVKDMDKYRVGNGGGNRGQLTSYLRKVYDSEFDIVRKDSPGPALEGEIPWQQLDYEETISRYETKYPDIQEKLDAAIQNWESKKTNIEHMKAADAANRAKIAMGCAAP